MSPEAPIRHSLGARKQSAGGGSWFATFSVLDVSSAISSSQLQRLVPSIAKLWRLTMGLLLGPR
jgi:hypothetical protein